VVGQHGYKGKVTSSPETHPVDETRSGIDENGEIPDFDRTSVRPCPDCHKSRHARIISPLHSVLDMLGAGLTSVPNDRQGRSKDRHVPMCAGTHCDVTSDEGDDGCHDGWGYGEELDLDG
jgi:hypothetical protein